MSDRIRHLCRITAAAAAGRREHLDAWYRAARGDGIALGDLQEATLQVFLFAGYPRTIDAFEALDAPTPPPLEPARGDFEARGRELFERIYGPHAPEVLDKLDALHSDFRRFVVRDAYGQVLGRPFLAVEERELMAVAMLA
ncbi:MAG: carboxymuconolactone decarboxylase family protein, partial [Planctomycetota bacterium]|nr:carboxymuconolactone decarboxylase family protein [Planctomycetota bacterium]